MEKNSKLALWTLIPAAVLVLVCRVWQLVTCVDYDTGFFSDGSGFWGMSLYILLGVAALGLILAIIFDKKKSSSAFSKLACDLSPKQTAGLGFVFLAAAACFFYDIFRGFEGKIDLGLIGNGIMCAVLLAVAFILLGNKSVKPAAGYIMILPAVGYTIKSAALFISDTVVVRESAKLLVLLSYIAAVLFYLAFGRFLSANETKSTRAKVIFFAGAAFLLNVASVAAAIVTIIAGPSPINAEVTVTAYSELGTCAAALAAFICLYMKNAPRVAAEAPSVEKTPEADDADENGEKE